MRTAEEIYDAYRIMPGLREHQLRVAAVAKTLCENLTREVDERSVVLACLLHDMGNIIKSDLTVFPEFLEPEGLAHWQLVKNDFVLTYGDDEHHATVHIIREIGLPPAVLQLVESIAFSNLVTTRDTDSLEQKIVEYADLRVAPHGVLSMGARMEEAKARYASSRSDIPQNQEVFESLVSAAYEVEKQIFAEALIAPDDITEQSVRPLVAALREYKVA
jgi:dGTP triphosphohydrolase